MIFRAARHSQNIQKLTDFYTKILGFEILSCFENHSGYNGVFVGCKTENWHLEFTENGEDCQTSFDNDDALVFYYNSDQYLKVLEQITKYELALVEPKNPYWRKNGICIQDPDGCNVILCRLEFKN